MKLKFLGTGTSQGVPVIGCNCEVCISKNPKDRRFRSSVMVTTDSGKKILIDCGPDFRMQMLQNHETEVDAVLITHEHNDHVIGLDDLRPLIFKRKGDMPIYSNKRVGAEIMSRFPYAFANVKYPGAPSFELHEIENKSMHLFDTEIIPIEVMHFKISIFGFKFKKLAYITDASAISEEEKEKLKGLDYLILNCIRKENPHPAHFILPDILKLNEELKPKKLFMTHISHYMGLHEVTNSELPDNVRLAFDGLELDF
ncbi:MBL fold metallo-hydrolase [Chryseobacterium koreense]|uniref:MBL fold metallo-hydrolase n=1 Tax=Chryseobacterium koreense TaxID=232216 RepID=UPI0026F0799A|nr:MBL fold metallo-hydrolase [Chryseobacterium koreense]